MDLVLLYYLLQNARYPGRDTVTPEYEQAQRVLDQAFARFKDQYPEVAQAIEAMNASYADYLLRLSSMQNDIPTVSGSALTPP